MLIMSAFVFIGYYVILQKYPMFFPYHYVRAMAGLCVGLLCFRVTQLIKNIKINIVPRRIISAVFLVCPIVLCFFNLTFYYISVFCFIVGFGFLLSETGYSNCCTDFMGKISFSLYLVSLNVADLINWFSANKLELNVGTQYILYFLLSFVLAVILEEIVWFIDGIIKSIKQNNNKNIN